MHPLSWEDLYDCLRRRPDDEVAWQSLERYVRKMPFSRDGAARRIRELGAHAVEDVVHDTCAEVIRNFEKARNRRTFAGFAWSRFRTECQRVLRRLQARPQTVPLGDFDPPAPGTGGPDRIEVAVLKECLDRLGQALPRQRQAVEMRFMDGRTPADIARALGVEVGNARRITSDGKARLRRCVKEQLGGT